MDVTALGPQRRADSPLLRRIRAHQSWYRAHILGSSDWGVTAPPNGTAYGSILSNDAAAVGANFTSDLARRAYRERRLLGWGVEPYRCERYLTSSQALTINLFGPLAAEPAWLARVLSGLGVGSLGPVEKTHLEYQPGFRRAGRRDRTLADAFVRTAGGGVVIETKLADQFSNRWGTAAGNPFYDQVAAEFALWQPGHSMFDTTAKDQLARVHSVGCLATGARAPLLVIHHPLDQAGLRHSERYREVLADPELLIVTDLDSVMAHLADTATTPVQRKLAEDLRVRYTAHELSEEAFQLLELARSSAGARSHSTTAPTEKRDDAAVGHAAVMEQT